MSFVFEQLKELSKKCKAMESQAWRGHTLKFCFPLCRVLEVPYAYQCCAYGSCSSFFRVSSQWEAEDMSPEEEDPHKRTLELFPGHTDNHCE